MEIHGELLRTKELYQSGKAKALEYAFALMSNWAYDFDCDYSLSEIASRMNNTGPWRWQARESAWYGDYLNSRPQQGLRVRIHQYPQPVEAGWTFTGMRESGFMALLELGKESTSSREEIDGIFRELLGKINAANVTSIDPYD